MWHCQHPFAARELVISVPRTPLSADGIYGNGGTAAGLLAVTALGSTPSAGYRGTLTVGVNPDA
ncbi:hypothetical protein [Streptomyces antimycoticus]|uniref:hypothetical protein n=1 Tax=Streptomyces antimycoticus TaxID=68175 RepID=UPI003F4E2722